MTNQNNDERYYPSDNFDHEENTFSENQPGQEQLYTDPYEVSSYESNSYEHQNSYDPYSYDAYSQNYGEDNLSVNYNQVDPSYDSQSDYDQTNYGYLDPYADPNNQVTNDYQDLYEEQDYYSETPYDFQADGYENLYSEQGYQLNSDFESGYEDQEYQIEYSDFDSEENENQFNKFIIPIAVIGAVLVVLIGFYVLREIGTFDKSSNNTNVSFEKETEPIKVEGPSKKSKTENEESSKGTVSVKSTSRLQGRKPGLTTVDRTRIPTTSAEVSISEREIGTTTTKPPAQRQSIRVTQKQTRTTVAGVQRTQTTQPATQRATTTQNPATTQATAAPTTTQRPVTTQATAAPTTTQKPARTNETTSTSTRSPEFTTSPESTSPILNIPNPVEINDDQVNLPKTNPLSKDVMEIFKDLPKEAIANRLVEKYALLKNKNTFEITNKDGTEEYSVSDISIDKLVSFNDNVAFFLASDQLYSFNLYDQELKQIENNVSVDYKEASFHAFDSESILIYSDEEIYEASLDRPSLTLVLDDVTDLKVRGKLYSFIHDEKIKFIDLSKSIPKSGPEELIESRVSKYQISPNGNSLTYISNNKVYTLKDNKIYQYTDNSVDFALTNNPDIILVYTDDKELIVVEIKDKPLVKSIYENVDKETLTENLTLDYGDNCAYVDVEDFKIIYEDEKTETVTLPKVTEPED